MEHVKVRTIRTTRALVMTALVALVGYMPVFAAGEDTSVESAGGISVSEIEALEPDTDADLRQLVYELMVDMDNVRDDQSWNTWMDQWHEVATIQYGTRDADTLDFGQVVEVPDHPADWEYVDWESVPYEVRPSVALAHACGVMTGRVDQSQNNQLSWDMGEYALRSEMANVSARILELMFEVMLSDGAHSRPGCPLAAESFWGDPEMFKSLVERQADRHAENVERLEEAIAELESRVGVDIDAATAEAARADLELRREFQARMEEILRDTNARWDELKDEVDSLRVALSEHDDKVREEFNALLEGFVTDEEFEHQDDRIDDLDARVTVLEATIGRISVDYCPVWLNFTGNAGVGEFDRQNPYRRGMEVSANVGVNALDAEAGVQIVSYDVGHGNRPNDRADWWKESAFHESLPIGTEISITVRDATGATCTRTHSLSGG